jgi:hypothetical protein
MGNVHWPTGRTVKILAVLTMAGGVLGMAPGIASASTCVSWAGTPPVNPSASGDLFSAVAARSACDVWAVGNKSVTGVDQTLAEHWNGLAWTVVPSSNPGGSTHNNDFAGVAAASPTTAWAVGWYSNGTADQTLIETLVGTVWEQESSPNPGGPTQGNVLNAVAATSAKNAWAVGYYSMSGPKFLTLIERWNGTTWRRVPSPSPGATESQLLGVAATSASNAWAVGYFVDSHSALQTLIEHWNGTAWKRVPSPNPGGSTHDNVVHAVAVSSASNAWAVGGYFNSVGHNEPLAEHWNGKAWKLAATPSLGSTASGGALAGVTILSGRNAWAVGTVLKGGNRTLALHWNGSRWHLVATPDLGSYNVLIGVASSGSATVWAVGDYNIGGPSLTLAIHCC